MTRYKVAIEDGMDFVVEIRSDGHIIFTLIVYGVSGVTVRFLQEIYDLRGMRILRHVCVPVSNQYWSNK